MTLESRDRLAGCLLAGAVGDALGAPVEFMRSRREIETRFGPGGPDGFVEGAAPAGAHLRERAEARRARHSERALER